MADPTYANEPVLELERAPARDSLLAALAELDASLPRRVPVVIGGAARHGDEIESVDPAVPAASSRAPPRPLPQRHLKRVIAEMGGKNCIVVDADADLDDAAAGVVRSAFGFAGQKCSAASLVLVHERVAAELVGRLRGALDSLQVDRGEVFGADVPPLIEASARSRVEAALATSAAGGATLHRGPSGPGDGFFVAPTVVTDAPPGATVLEQELFGPVVAVEPVPGIGAACARVDRLPFALTGGVYSRDPRTVAEVVRATPVGNLYVNRHITGAMVGRQPFGGNRLSGNGAKAGGSDYLLHFVDQVVVTERTV